MYFVFRVPNSGCEGVISLSIPVSNMSESTKINKIPIKSRFGKDDNNIYRMAISSWDTNLCVPIKHADYDTFEVLSANYAKDKNNAYLAGAKKRASKYQYTIFNIDSESFVVVDAKEYRSKDKNHDYFKTQIIKDEPSYDQSKILDGSSPISH